MNTPKVLDYIEVARQGKGVLIRVHGLGNMKISLTMSDFVNASLSADYLNFALDLAQCRGMDSTFMGTIISIARAIADADGWLCLINVSAQNRDLLDMIGVSRFINFREGFKLETVEMECLLPDNDPSRRIRLIRRAHEHLVEIDARNRERFGRFLAALEEEMDTDKKHVEESPQALLAEDSDEDE
jgi:anti-anti-sigma factor